MLNDPQKLASAPRDLIVYPERKFDWPSGRTGGYPARPDDDILGVHYIRADIADAEKEAAVRAERDACAKVAEDFWDQWRGIASAKRIAAAIRARGE